MVDPLTASAIIAGGAALGGGLLKNRATRKNVDKQLAFQDNLNNTRYQRSVADARKAGLNPILIARNGPHGSFSSVGANFENVGASAAQAYNQVAGGNLNIEKARTEVVEQGLKKAYTEMSDAQKRHFEAMIDLTGAQADKVRDEAYLLVQKKKTLDFVNEKFGMDIDIDTLQSIIRSGGKEGLAIAAAIVALRSTESRGPNPNVDYSQGGSSIGR